MAQPGGQDDQVYVAILIMFFVITVMAILGPIGVAVALATIVIGTIARLGHAGDVARKPCRWLPYPVDRLKSGERYQRYLLGLFEVAA